MVRTRDFIDAADPRLGAVVDEIMARPPLRGTSRLNVWKLSACVGGLLTLSVVSLIAASAGSRLATAANDSQVTAGACVLGLLVCFDLIGAYYLLKGFRNAFRS